MTHTPKNVKKQNTAKPFFSLGPVADLESHLPEDWWKEIFNALYVKTDGDIYENTYSTKADVDMIISVTGIKPYNHILDLCCGQGRHSIELARRGYTKITGVDRSRYLVRLAKKRAEDAHLEIVFKEGDARAPKIQDGSMDMVMIMGNSFGYFADEQDDQKVLESAARVLKNSGSLIIDTMEGEWIKTHFEPRSWEWIDKKHFVCRERSLSSDGDRLISREIIINDEYGVIADQFYAERLYTRERIRSMLEAAHYREVRFHGNVESISDRDQDLGMMAKRMVLSAVAPRKITAVTNKRHPVFNIAVLLGDPRLPDKVKRNGQFNKEDFETIEKLKDALSDLPEYKFTYLDNHATLERDLKEMNVDMAFNLCDEGWNNDPFKELHVPSYLETKDIPYTGASPTCLGICYDKALVRAIASSMDIPVPLETFIRANDQGGTLPSVFPAILKPNFGDSSVGITKNAIVNNTQQFLTALQDIKKIVPDVPILVQEFLSGKEYSVSLIGNPGSGFHPLPVLEVDYSKLPADLPKILGYESKWLPNSDYCKHIDYIETSLEKDTQNNLIDYSEKLFERLGCRDYARFDFRADGDGNVKLLEVNPNPGWCWDGKMNLMADMAGLSYQELLALILKSSRDRIGLDSILSEREKTKRVA